MHTTSCTVSYEPPRRDGGAPVTGYILERRTPGPCSRWIRVNDTPATDLQYTIDNLTPDIQYEFRVAAVNKAVMSDFSVISQKIMTGEKPGKPGLPGVVDVTGTSVRLQWTAPSSDDGANVTKYIVSCTSDEMKEITISVDVRVESFISYTIRNQLQANTKYRFAVAAVNKLGQGPWSDRTEDILTYAGTLNILYLVPYAL